MYALKIDSKEAMRMLNNLVDYSDGFIKETKAKEIVLTGVNTGDFGRHNGESFFELIQQLDLLEGAERIRISSIEPNLLSDAIIEFASTSNKFVPHFHIPLQSGNNNENENENDKYSTREEEPFLI